MATAARRFLAFLLLILVVPGAPLAAPKQRKAPGAGYIEVFRRQAVPGTVFRLKQGTIILFEGPVTGDIRGEFGQSVTPLPVTLSSVTLPASIMSSTQGQGLVSVTAPAGPLGEVVALSSSSPLLELPLSVTVPPGQAAVPFAWSAGRATLDTPITVTATKGAITRVATTLVKKAEEEPPPPPPPPPGTNWYVSPAGLPTNLGTIDSPWDLASTVSGTRRPTLAKGGTVYLYGGTYRIEPVDNREGLGYRCTMTGLPTSPLIFRPLPGAKVTIDGGWSFFPPAADCWLWGVNVTVSDLLPGRPPFGLSGSWPEGAPNGGISFYGSLRCKAINCFAFRNRQGYNLWTEAQDAELYGCTAYDNGWKGSDRAHGHGIYVQNPATWRKRIEDCILTHTSYSVGWGDGRYGMHGYGERVAVTNIDAVGNFLYGMGDAWLLDDGAVLGPSSGHTMIDNLISGVRVRYGARADQPILLRGNILVNGQLEGPTGAFVMMENNLIAPPAARPALPTISLRINKYDPSRAHLMIVDWRSAGTVKADLSAFVRSGNWLSVRKPTDFYGQPLFEGAYPADGLPLKVSGGAEAYILVKQETWPTLTPSLPPGALRSVPPALVPLPPSGRAATSREEAPLAWTGRPRLNRS